MAKPTTTTEASPAAGTVPATKANVRRRPKIDPNETKSARFRRLATSRMSVALKALTSVSNLSGNGYEYTDAQVAKIVGDLTARVEQVKKSFESHGTLRTRESYNI